MIQAFGETDITRVSRMLLDNVKIACHNRSDIQHRSALWKATALLILTPDLDRKLLHCIASSQVLYKMCF